LIGGIYLIVLAINCGSSTLKFRLIDIPEEATLTGKEQRLADGVVDRIGSGEGEIRFSSRDSGSINETTHITDHEEATRRVLDWLYSFRISNTAGIEAVGHRVVHGRNLFKEPAVIDDEVIRAIESISQLAPLHNRPSLLAIRAARAIIGPAIPQVATFDTTFHATIPQQASVYAIPHELIEKYHIRRYGFHGLAHRYMSERYAIITGIPVEKIKLITLQLGNGCSVTAVSGGRSVDTSMGFTPLEGLIMGTRSGDLDPSLVSFLSRQEKVDVEDVESWLNTRSGLLGISGYSSDMRELLKAESEGNNRARQAVELFCYRVRKYIGAYMAVLNGVDAVVFGGGIGENSPEIRRRICDGMEWCGLSLNEELNTAAIGIETGISSGRSRVSVYVIPVDEEMIIAHDTVRFLQHHD